MAIISKIRKQSTVLLIAIGGAMLLFILGDFLTSSSVFFSGPDTEVGEIDGKKITYMDFERELQQIVVQQFGGRNPDELGRSQLRDRVWDDFIRSVVYEDQFEALGLSVPDEEMIDLIKNDSDNPVLRSFFTNPQTGQVIPQFASPDGSLNTEMVMRYFQQVLSADPSADEQALEAQRLFRLLKQNLYTNTQDEKYFALIQKGLYVPQSEYEQTLQANARKIDIRYVAQYYSSLPDSAYKPTEQQLKAYYNEHKNDPQFKQNEDVRALEFIQFEVMPSPADQEALRQALVDMIPAFQTTQDDTLFVNENADSPFNIRWISQGQWQPDLDTMLMTATVDSVLGPYQRNGNYEIAKVREFITAPDSARARHILIPILDGDTTAAQALADSLRGEVRTNADLFGLLASQFSADSASAVQGGSLGWFTYGTMVPAFNEACFQGEEGDLTTVITRFGVHLIEVQEQTAPSRKAQVAVIDSRIMPSDKTRDEMYSQANGFAINNATSEAFEEQGQAFGLQQAPTVRKNDVTFMGIEQSREVVKWAYTAEVGDVSPVFTLGDVYLVAHLKEIREEGVLPFELVEPLIEEAVIQEMKAEELAEKMKGTTDLNQLAGSLSATVQTAPGLTFGAFSLPGLGSEPDVQGIVFTLNEGQISQPVQGRRGVYVMQVDRVSEEADPIAMSREQVSRSYRGRVNFSAYEALRERTSIEDNRASFY